METQSEHKIKVFRSDNGGEYISNEFKRFLKAHDIEKQTSTPFRPQQNGVAERANRTLVEMARSMLHAQNLKKSLWAYWKQLENKQEMEHSRLYTFN